MYVRAMIKAAWKIGSGLSEAQCSSASDFLFRIS
jgi:hypothetical protein